MSLPKPGDPYISPTGKVIESASLAPTDSVEYSRVPNILKHKASVPRSQRDMPSTNPTQQHAINVIMVYHLLGMTPNEIAHSIGATLTDVQRVMKDETFQETFELMFGEIVNLNSNSLAARIQHYSHTAMQTIFDLSKEADKDMVRLKAAQDIVDRSGIAPRLDRASDDDKHTGGLRIVIQDVGDKATVNVNLNAKR